MRTASFLLLALLVLPLCTDALSRSIGRDIEFPKGYDLKRAEDIRAVIRDVQFEFVDGIVSYWPPDWATRLSFEGDVNSLNTFLARIRAIPGIGMKVTFYKGRESERQYDSAWQLAFSHARPQQLTVHINLNSKALELEAVKLPEWEARSNEKSPAP